MKTEIHKLFCRIPVKLFQALLKESNKRGLTINALVILLLEEKING